MQVFKPKSVRRDLLAGFAAIVFVLACAILTQFVGADLRVLFAVTGTAFYFAGLARGLSAPVNRWIKAILVSSPGLIGTAALIMNDGLHRYAIPLAVTLTAILLTLAGVETRRWWSRARGASFLLGGASAVALGAWVTLAVPAIVIHSSLKVIDRAAPDFSVTDSDDRVIKAADLKGHVVVLAFWATWCLPCHWELPEIEAVHEAFKENPEVIVLDVDADWGGETPEGARKFFVGHKWTTPWVFDSGGVTERALGVDSLPTIIVLDKDGQVRRSHYGYDASEHVGRVIATSVDRLLAGMPRTE